MASSIDFLPTLAALAGTAPPADRIIDGKDLRPLLSGEAGAESPRDTFFYYFRNSLMAVRQGRWKLHVQQSGPGHVDQPTLELYDLEDDIAESTNVADIHPDVVARLQALLAACREDIGDEATGVAGQNCRPIGQVENPAPLTEYDESHPYMVACYDLEDSG